MTMADADYAATLRQLAALADCLGRLDLAGFRQRYETAQALAPILNPTLYRRGSDAMGAVGDLLGAFEAAQDRAVTAVAMLRVAQMRATVATEPAR